MRWQVEHNHIKIKFYTCQVGDPNWRTIIPKKFSHSCKVSRPHIRFPNLGSQKRDWESPWNLESQWNLITEFPQGWRKQRLLEGTNKTLHAPGPRGKEQ